MDQLRIAMLGGTFNPVHHAHLFMAQAARAACGLDRVLLMVDRDPPHKQIVGDVTAAQRLEMAQLAAKGIEGVAVSDLELTREGKSYTVDTLRALRAQMPEAALYCIVGGDMLCDLPNWREVQAICEMAHIICVPRQNRGGSERADMLALKNRYGADVTMLDVAAPDISSTQLRERIAAAQPIEGLTAGPVEAYIYEEGFYFPPAIRGMQLRLREMLSPGRYRHSMGVVRAAVGLAERYGANCEAARMAALLHDCGRAVDSGGLTHAAQSVALAREQFGVADEAVLRAIRLHTTGGADMTLLDKIVYLADAIEPRRDYAGVQKLRALASRDLTAAVVLAMRQTIGYLQTKGKPIDQATTDALRALTGEGTVK